MNKQNSNRLKDTENIMMVTRWGWEVGKVGEIGKKVEGIKKYKLVVTNSHRDVKYSIRNTVNNILITMYGVRWILDLSG